MGDKFLDKLLLIPTILGIIFLIKYIIHVYNFKASTNKVVAYLLYSGNFTMMMIVLKLLFVQLDIMSPNTETYLLNDNSLMLSAIVINFMMVSYHKYVEYSVIPLLLIYYYCFLHLWGLTFQSSLCVCLALLLLFFMLYFLSRYRGKISRYNLTYFFLVIGITLVAELICLSEYPVSYLYISGVFLKTGFIFILAKVIFFSINLIIKEYTDLRSYSYQDKLTGIGNRRKFDEVVSAIFDSKRISVLSAVLLDVDSFKEINDKHGHDAGDYILKKICDIITEIFIENKDNGQLFRYGGDEFFILFRNVRGYNVKLIMEHIVREIAEYNFRYNMQDLSITISVGVSEITHQQTVKEIINEVDKKLYSAKGQGKNQVYY